MSTANITGMLSTIAERKGPYLELDTANAVKIRDIYKDFKMLAGYGLP